jgi:NAD(P)-dependent dehydrogenase (short-subunit alcohol dehydrogenase family)
MTVSATVQYAPAARDLRGKTVLVTGGTRGIGRGICLALGAAGARTLVSGRDRADAEEVAAQIVAAGGAAGVLTADLQDDGVVAGLLEAAASRFGDLDVLVNNAGIDADAPALDYDLASWRRVLRFNLEVPFRLSQAAARHFLAHGRGGAIINIASVLGQVGTAEACAYVAAKHGLVGLTKALAIEWAGRGVRVNAVAPGLIQTDMTSYLWRSDVAEAYVKGRIPLGRIGQPRDIGGAVAFLASDAADFIHGETLAVDGGFLAT